jgi:hypothetical protein
MPFYLFSNVAKITGKITLEDNNPADNVKIEFVSSINPNEKYEFHTDENGNLDFEIKFGIYKITFSKNLYQTRTLSEEWVNSDKNYNFTLLKDKYFGLLKTGKYTFDRNIIVPHGDTLIIQEGTEIHLLGSSSIIAEGFLFANGTEENPIKIYKDNWELNRGINLKTIEKKYSEEDDNSVIDRALFENVLFEKISIYNSDSDYPNNIIFEKCKFINDNNLSFSGKKVLLNNCELFNNNVSPYLIYAYLFSEITIVNSKCFNNNIKRNSSISSIIGTFNSYCKLINCIFESNETEGYAILESYDNSFLISNCLFKKNKSGEINSLFYGNATIYNSIFWENKGDEFNRTKGLKNNQIYNCLFYKSENLRVDSEIKFFGVNFTTNDNGDSVDVFGNLFEDPDLGFDIDDEIYDIWINETSKCIDAGMNNELVEKYDKDINGNRRIVDGNLKGSYIVDIGPVEYQTHISMNVNKRENLLNIFPNPASESITISGVGLGKLELYNTLGQKLFEKEITGTTQINTSTLQTGLYIIKLESGSEVVFEKVIIAR